MNKSTTKNLFHAALAAGTLVIALGSGTRAGDLPQVHVSYADLNINSSAGAAVLYQRILIAAKQVCGTPDWRDLARFVQTKACTDKATADAVNSVGNPLLTELYQAKTHIVARVKFASN